MTTQPEITIREARRTDIETLVSFNSAMAMESEGKSLDLATLTGGTSAVFDDPQKGFYLVAEVGGSVVGSLLVVEEWSDWRNSTFWWVQSVYVRPDWRRKGVYRTLHDWVHQAARARPDVCGIRLYVDQDNLPAQATYTSLGMSKSHYDLFEIDFTV